MLQICWNCFAEQVDKRLLPMEIFWIITDNGNRSETRQCWYLYMYNFVKKGLLGNLGNARKKTFFFMWRVSIVTQYTAQSIPRLVFSFLQIGKIYEHQYLGPPKWKHVVSLPNLGRPSSISWDLIFIQNLSLKSRQSQEYRYAPNLISFEIIFPNCINVQYHYWHEKQIYK